MIPEFGKDVGITTDLDERAKETLMRAKRI